MAAIASAPDPQNAASGVESPVLTLPDFCFDSVVLAAAEVLLTAEVCSAAVCDAVSCVVDSFVSDVMEDVSAEVISAVWVVSVTAAGMTVISSFCIRVAPPFSLALI